MSDSFLDNLLARRTEILDELETLNAYIATYQKRSKPKSRDRELGVSLPDRGGKHRGRPEEVADAVEDLLRASNHPMTRGVIAKALMRRGFRLPQTDPAKYVGTILWRNRDRFENREGEGYALVKRRRS